MIYGYDIPVQTGNFKLKKKEEEEEYNQRFLRFGLKNILLFS